MLRVYHRRGCKETRKQRLTLALAFLQFVHALGVTESGTFLFLPDNVPGRDKFDARSEVVGSVEVVGFVGDEDWKSGGDWPELSVPVVSERFLSELAIPAISAMASSTVVSSTVVASWTLPWKIIVAKINGCKGERGGYIVGRFRVCRLMLLLLLL